MSGCIEHSKRKPRGLLARLRLRSSVAFQSLRWMNEERGHEGIGMRALCEIYTPSSREWRHRPDEPEYPGNWEVC